VVDLLPDVVLKMGADALCQVKENRTAEVAKIVLRKHF